MEGYRAKHPALSGSVGVTQLDAIRIPHHGQEFHSFPVALLERDPA